MRFAALGRTKLLLDAIRACAAAGHEPVLLGTAEAAPEYGAVPEDFEALARELGCPHFCSSTLDTASVRDLIRHCRPDVGISMNWPRLIEPSVLAEFPHGIINAHGGDLPRYRGNACPNWAILARERSMAVVLHRMDSELDAGPVLARRQMTLTAMTYVADIYSFLAVAVPELFVRVLAEIDAGEAVAVAQPEDPTIALRGFPRLPSDSEIDWAETADHIAAIVRASGDPYCGAFTYWNGARLTVRRARADDLPYPWMGTPGQVAEVRPQSGEVVVLCGRGVLVLEQVQYDGPARRPAADVIRSGRARLGVDVSEDLASLRRRVADLERRLRERESAHDEEDGECKA